MTESLSHFIKSTAIQLGFDACGIAKAEKLNEDAEYLNDWIRKGMHGSMLFMENNFDKRIDPCMLVPGCQSVVVVILNYYTDLVQPPNSPKIARYAFSVKDYHFVLKEKLKKLEEEIRVFAGDVVVNPDVQHMFVDSAPVLERRWAQRAGLGWIGKNKQFIAEGLGSFCFIGTLFLNVETEFDEPIKDKCGNCTKCIDVCPTNSLKNGVLDARKCISYLTIEHKDSIPKEFENKLAGYIVGCDICTEVCPWNKKWAKPHQNTELTPFRELLVWKNDDWIQLTSSDFKKNFKSSAISRVGYKKLKYNVELKCRLDADYL